MSSKSIDKKGYKFNYDIRDTLQIKNIIIPFTSIFINQERYIYSGEEKIPFKKRDPFYITILLNEFRE